MSRATGFAPEAYAGQLGLSGTGQLPLRSVFTPSVRALWAPVLDKVTRVEGQWRPTEGIVWAPLMNPI